MFGIQSPRQTLLRRAVLGLVAGLFGVLWSALIAAAQIPYLSLVLVGAGVLFTLSAWGYAGWRVMQFTGQQSFLDDEIDHSGKMSASRFLPGEPAALVGSGQSNCVTCRTPLEPTFRYCPHCGVRVERR